MILSRENPIIKRNCSTAVTTSFLRASKLPLRTYPMINIELDNWVKFKTRAAFSILAITSIGIFISLHSLELGVG